MRRQYPARLIKVADGNNVDLTVDLGFMVFTSARFRIAGIFAPESGEPGDDEAERFIQRWFQSHGYECLIETEKAVNGEWFAHIYPRPSQNHHDSRKRIAEALNREMVDQGHAKVGHTLEMFG